MSRRFLIGLLVVVVGVGWAVNWQMERERRGDFDVARPLFPGLEFERVVGMRISHVERGSDMGLERDGQGVWYLVDPVAYRADEGLMELMRQITEGNLALQPADPTVEWASVGLDPPRAEWVVTEQVGEERVAHRLLVGAVDATGNRVHILQGGEVLLTSRTLDTTLDRDFQDFRRRRILGFDPAHVLHVERSGRMQHAVDEEPYDLGLSAWREGLSWRALHPFEAALDPLDVSLLVVGAARLNFEEYIEEPEVDLGVYGLEYPEVVILLEGQSGVSDELYLGRPGVGGAWFCRRASSSDVYRVADRDAVLLTFPSEAMIDRRLMRVATEDVLAIRLERAEGVVRLAREGAGWVVAAGDGAAVPAEGLLVRALLAWVAEVELDAFDEVASDGAGGVVDGALSLILETTGGELGGWIGGVAPGEGGGASGSVFYRRLGDDVVGRLDAEVLEWLGRGVDAWWSLSLLDLDELEVEALELERDGEVLRFERGDRGRWRDAKGREARELLEWLDPLLFLRATERRVAAGARELGDVVRVRFVLRSGEERVFAVGLGPSAKAECEIGPVRAVLLRADLHAGLVRLFG